MFARHLFSSGFKLFKFQDPRWRGKFIKDLINCNAFRQLPDKAALTADMVGLVGESNSLFRAKLSVRELVHKAAHLAEDWCVRSDLLKLNDMPVQLDGYRAYVARNFPVGHPGLSSTPVVPQLDCPTVLKLSFNAFDVTTNVVTEIGFDNTSEHMVVSEPASTYLAPSTRKDTRILKRSKRDTREMALINNNNNNNKRV